MRTQDSSPDPLRPTSRPRDGCGRTRLIEIVVLLAALGSSLTLWTSQVRLSPDSTNYVVAAKNLLEHGELFLYVNWPSRSLEPVTEPYTEYPPGFPLYLCAFLLVFKDTMLAIVVAQALAIVLCYLGLTLFMQALRLPTGLRCTGYLLFASFSPFRHVFSSLWSEPLFIAISLVCGACALRVLGDSHRRGDWWLGLACLCLSGCVKIIGAFNCVWFLLPLWRSQHRRLWRTLVVMAMGMGPGLLWLLRNKVLYGHASFSHLGVSQVPVESIWLPLQFLQSRLLTFAAPSGFGLLILALIAVAFIFKALQMAYRPRRPDGSEPPWHDSSEATHGQRLTLALACGAHFFGLWALSLVATVDPLRERLLAPALILGLLLILAACAWAGRRVTHPLAGLLLAALPLLFLALNRHMALSWHRPGHWQNVTPLEAALWQRLEEEGLLASTTHFYSDPNFKHQLFAGLPQRILWDKELLDTPASVAILARTGTHPLFVFSVGSAEQRLFRRHSGQTDSPYRGRLFPELGFVVFHQALTVDTEAP